MLAIELSTLVTVKSMMKELSKAEEIARCQDTVTRLILAFRGLDKHDRSGRSKLERQLEEEKSKLLSLGRSDCIFISPSAPSSVWGLVQIW